ncbi:MAG: AAA family ATPase [Tissierellia bacterium]|nr:AAA family ATPase [Tissierellia bacterium]
MKDYHNIDELAKKYALTNEQMLDYLLMNVDGLGDFDTIDVTNRDIVSILERIDNKTIHDHTNSTALNRIEIVGLFGKFNYSIEFHDDISIWVSENGIGKTTILNIIVAILSGDVKALMEINFQIVRIVVGNEEYVIDKEQYFRVNNKSNHYSKRIDYLIDELSMYIPKRYAIKLRNDYVHRKYIDLDYLEDLFLNYFRTDTFNDDTRITILHELKELQYRDLSKLLLKIKSSLKEDIVFYPTYRRAEVSFEKIFSNNRDRSIHFEAPPKYMGFGMDDVKKRIDSLLNKMRRDANSAYIEMNAKIISELLNKSISNYISAKNMIDMHKVDVIINRIGEDRIESIDSLRSFLEGSNNGKNSPNFEFLLYYLQKLMKIYDEQKPLDTKLSKFAEVCTKYISSKKIVYDEALLTMNVYGYDNEKIDFEDLSSGEKQVISIFSKVYLDVVTPCIFIIDEPEISLSIEWQKEFLQDIYKSGKIGLMIVTTHSPFIFKNEYRRYVVELEKYLEV